MGRKSFEIGKEIELRCKRLKGVAAEVNQIVKEVGWLKARMINAIVSESGLVYKYDKNLPRCSYGIVEIFFGDRKRSARCYHTCNGFLLMDIDKEDFKSGKRLRENPIPPRFTIDFKCD